jgi:hypothetical protein
MIYPYELPNDVKSDADRAPDVKTLYTQISRGKNKVYLYSTN